MNHILLLLKFCIFILYNIQVYYGNKKAISTNTKKLAQE